MGLVWGGADDLPVAGQIENYFAGSMKDLGKILKLLELSTSQNDGEALNAVRKANEMRAKAGLEWKEVFEKLSGTPGSITEIIPPISPRRPQPKFHTVNTMLDEILNRSLSDVHRARMEEIKYSYELLDSLSGKEINALINTFNGNIS